MIKRVTTVVLLIVGIVAIVPAASAETVNVRIVEQTYASNLPADPYRNDASNIHVSASGGNPTAQAYLLMDFGGIPVGATITRVSLKLVPDGVPGDNAGTPEMGACVLAERLKVGFNPSTDPKPSYDCARALVPGLLAQDGTWTFEINPIVALWQQFANTGLAIVPTFPPSPTGVVAPVGSATWQAGFAKAGSTITAIVIAPTARGASDPEPETGVITVSPTLVESPGLPAEPAAEIAPSAPVTAAPIRAATSAFVINMRWILVMLGALAAIAGILFAGAAQQVRGAGARLLQFAGGVRATYSQRAEVIGALILIAVIAAGLVTRVISNP